MTYERADFNSNAAALASVAEKGARRFAGMHQAAMAPGALDRSTKELMALAISIATGCEDCCGHHLEEALAADATHAEVAETLELAMMMGGGPAYTYAGKVAKMLQDR